MAKQAITFTGQGEVISNLEAMKKTSQKRVRSFLRREAFRVRNYANANLVPYEFGDLAKSGKVHKSETTKVNGSERVSVSVSYGNDSVDYAIEQHENPNYKHTNGRSWKYLEKAINANREGMLNRLAEEIKSQNSREVIDGSETT